ncbi:MAG TPA: M4 family metallopeptidase, partial [Chthoniobacterales bacterium]
MSKLIANNSRRFSALSLVAGAAILFFFALADHSRSAGAGAASRQQSAATPEAAQPARDALAALQSSSQMPITAEVSRATGRYDFVKAAPGAVLVSDNASAQPQERATQFLSAHGGMLGVSNAADLRAERTQTDDLGYTHVRLNQFHNGVKVFGAQLIVHMNGEGITAVNGNYVPEIAVSTTPALSAEAASNAALITSRKSAADAASAKVTGTELAIYPAGLADGRPVVSRLAYGVEVESAKNPEQVWIDAETGAVLARIPRHHTVLNRTIYSPNYQPDNPDLFVQRREGDPPHPAPFVNNLYDFAGQTYNMYRSGFNFDSYDGAGKKMISVYLINEQCPNAYWNGESTNYCPAFDADDVVSHEWSHAYTQFTHGLVYAFQSGALNESYSDIFGETVDLLNNADGIGGNNNAKPYPEGQRWLVGEDLGQEAQELLLRDMYDPDRLGDPGKVSSINYACGTDDGGGVHTNSGVPNHAYALIVDGTQYKPAVPEINQAAGTYNGQTSTGIGLTKAAAIYFRAEDVYQVPTTGFAQHSTALQTSCSDLTGAQLKNLSTTNGTGTNSSEVITANDCAQIAKAMLAVEMSATPPCAFGPLLNPDAAPICVGATNIFSEDWESGEDGWTKTSSGFATGTVDWEDESKAATRFFK